MVLYKGVNHTLLPSSGITESLNHSAQPKMTVLLCSRLKCVSMSIITGCSDHQWESEFPELADYSSQSGLFR